MDANPAWERTAGAHTCRVGYFRPEQNVPLRCHSLATCPGNLGPLGSPAQGGGKRGRGEESLRTEAKSHPNPRSGRIWREGLSGASRVLWAPPKERRLRALPGEHTPGSAAGVPTSPAMGKMRTPGDRRRQCSLERFAWHRPPRLPLDLEIKKVGVWFRRDRVV